MTKDEKMMELMEVLGYGEVQIMKGAGDPIDAYKHCVTCEHAIITAIVAKSPTLRHPINVRKLLDISCKKKMLKCSAVAYYCPEYKLKQKPSTTEDEEKQKEE